MKMKRENFLELVISQEQMSMGLTSIDNNLRWERSKDSIKLCSSASDE